MANDILLNLPPEPVEEKPIPGNLGSIPGISEEQSMFEKKDPEVREEFMRNEGRVPTDSEMAEGYDGARRGTGLMWGFLDPKEAKQTRDEFLQIAQNPESMTPGQAVAIGLMQAITTGVGAATGGMEGAAIGAKAGSSTAANIINMFQGEAAQKQKGALASAQMAQKDIEMSLQVGKAIDAQELAEAKHELAEEKQASSLVNKILEINIKMRNAKTNEDRVEAQNELNRLLTPAKIKKIAAETAHTKVKTDKTRVEIEKILADIKKISEGSQKDIKPMSAESAGRFASVYATFSNDFSPDLSLHTMKWDLYGHHEKEQARTRLGETLGRMLSGAAIPESEWKKFKLWVPGVKDEPSEAQYKLKVLRSLFVTVLASMDPSGQHRRNIATELRKSDKEISGEVGAGSGSRDVTMAEFENLSEEEQNSHVESGGTVDGER